MVTRSKRVTGQKNQGKGRVKVGKLRLNKETVKDLTGRERKQIKGGLTYTCAGTCGCGLPVGGNPLSYTCVGTPGCALPGGGVPSRRG